jgi:hypothetical protein
VRAIEARRADRDLGAFERADDGLVGREEEDPTDIQEQRVDLLLGRGSQGPKATGSARGWLVP